MQIAPGFGNRWMQTAPVPDANGAFLECRVRACWMQTAPVLDADGVCFGCRLRLSWRQSSPVLDADSASASVAHRSCSRASCSRAIAHIAQRVAQRVAHEWLSEWLSECLSEWLLSCSASLSLVHTRAQRGCRWRLLDADSARLGCRRHVSWM